MRLSLNLSRRPFTNHRLLWTGLTCLLMVSLWLVVWTNSAKGIVSARADELGRQIKTQAVQIDNLRQELEKKKAQVKTDIVLTDQEAAELAAARQLIEEKAFSWNRMISDFERYVPKDVRIASIKVDEIHRIGNNAIASIEIHAEGKTAAQMTEMMTNLDASNGLFVTGPAVQAAVDEQGMVPFSLGLTYDPARRRD